MKEILKKLEISAKNNRLVIETINCFSFIVLHQQTEDQRFDSEQLQSTHPES